MPRLQKAFNPFYFLLLMTGLVFSLTATAYCVMAFKMQAIERAEQGGPQGEALLQWLDKKGPALMAVELVVLGIATFAAIGTDEYWKKRFAKRQGIDSEK